MFEGGLMWADIAIDLGAANTVVIEKWGTIVSGSVFDQVMPTIPSHRGDTHPH